MARWITFILFGGLGFVMLYVGITQYFQQRRLLRNARRIDVTITRSEVITSKSANTDRRPLRNNSTTSHRPEVRFRYEIDGRTYESDLLTPTIIVTSSASRESAEEFLKPYPVNARVSAWVDPASPDKAFLQLERSAGPIVFIILGVVLPPLAWFVGKYV